MEILENLPDQSELKQLAIQGKLKLWPEDNYSDPNLLNRPLVILLHGVNRGLLDMTDPLSQNTLPYDINWEPETKDEGYDPYAPLLGIEHIESLIEDFSKDPSVYNALEALLCFEMDFSPRIEGDVSWFSYLTKRSFPVLTYSMSKTGDPLDSQGGAYEQFLKVMVEIDKYLLKHEKGGLAGIKKIALVGHSRGGLMARRYIVEALSGLLGPEHTDLVTRRVRFLGTLNSPHFGSTMGEIPDLIQNLASWAVPLPFISDWIGELIRFLVDLGVSALDWNPNTVDELSPSSSLVRLLNLRDQIWLGNNRDRDRIKRVSTGSDAPVIRRFFTYVYDPESFIPVGLITPMFHWTKSPFEIPPSPLLEEIGNLPNGTGSRPSVWEMVELMGLFIYPVIPVEPRARRRDVVSGTTFIGGDILVSDISAQIPGGEHRTFQCHHGTPLWNNAHQGFITERIPTKYPYPPLYFKLGDNVIEISWNSLPPQYNPYRVWCFNGSSQPQLLGEVAETLYYHSINSLALLKYQVTYPINVQQWVLPDETEADTAGRVPVTITTIRLSNGLDESVRNLDTRLAFSPTVDNYIALLSSYRSLLSENLSKRTLQPNRDRIIAFTDDNRVSEASSTQEEDEKTLSTWLTFNFSGYPLDTPPEPAIPGTGTVSSGGGVVPERPSNTETAWIIDKEKILFRLYASQVENDGTLPNPSLLVEKVEDISPKQRQIIESFSLTLESPKMIRIESKRLFAFTAGSSFNLYLVESDLNLAPSTTHFAYNEINPRPVAISPDSYPDQLVLHHFLNRGQKQWIALLMQGPRNLIIVAGEGLQVTAKSNLTLPWDSNGCLGAIFEDQNSLLLLPSSSQKQNPKYAFVILRQDGSKSEDPNWQSYFLPEVNETVIYMYQDVIKRCERWVDVLVSSDGYFKKDDISSSLYRMIFSKNGASSICKLHHSAFGRYKVSAAKTEKTLPNLPCAWNSESSSFDPGLYGQLAEPGTVDCSLTGRIPPAHVYHPGLVGGKIPPDAIRDYLRKHGLIWTDPLADVLGTPGFLPKLLNNNNTRCPTLSLLNTIQAATHVGGKTPAATRGSLKTALSKVKYQTMRWLDALYLEKTPETKSLKQLHRVLNWCPPDKRIKKNLKKYENCLTRGRK